jgi:hypothetical protein
MELTSDIFILLLQLPCLKFIKFYGDRSNYSHPSFDAIDPSLKFPALEEVDLACYNASVARVFAKFAVSTIKKFRWQMLACPMDSMDHGFWVRLDSTVTSIFSPFFENSEISPLEVLDLGTESVLHRDKARDIVLASVVQSGLPYTTPFMEEIMKVAVRLFSGEINLSEAGAEENFLHSPH